jgi:hypothetical protein
MSDDEIEKTYSGEFGTIKTHADGSVTMQNDTINVEGDGEGNARVTIEKITKVSIDNIVDVLSHEIKTDDSATSHHIIYRDGGEAWFSYRVDGKLLELRASRLSVRTSREGAVTFVKIEETK